MKLIIHFIIVLIIKKDICPVIVHFHELFHFSIWQYYCLKETRKEKRIDCGLVIIVSMWLTKQVTGKKEKKR